MWEFGVHFLKMLAKIKVQFLRLTIKLSRFIGKFGFGGGDHAQEKFCLLGFLDTTTNDVFEIFPRYALIRLAIICANACSAASQLVDQPIVFR